MTGQSDKPEALRVTATLYSGDDGGIDVGLSINAPTEMDDDMANRMAHLLLRVAANLFEGELKGASEG